MTFWGIFIMLLSVVIVTLIVTYYIYSIIKSSDKINYRLIFFILAESSLLILYIVMYSYAMKNTFDNVVKNSYYKGVSVKVIPKINSDYKIEKMDSVFYINE